jgi:hypothetical protein
MSNLVPIIEELENCRTAAERARWLLQCPSGYLGKYEMTIRNRLRIAGFVAGVDALETERLVIWMPRKPDGGLSDKAAEMLSQSRQILVIIAEGGP